MNRSDFDNLCHYALERGWRLEQALADKFGNGLARNFRTIDRFVRETGQAISVKSVDLAAKTYQNAGALYSRLSGYVRALANFEGGGAGINAVRPDNVQSKTLEIVIKVTDLTVEQAEEIVRLSQNARAQGVTIKVVGVQ